MFHKSFDMATGNGTAVREQEMAWLFKTGLASKCQMDCNLDQIKDLSSARIGNLI